MTCTHTHVFFSQAGTGVCLDCEADIERTKAFDVKPAPKAPSTLDLLSLAEREIDMVRIAYSIQLAIIALEASNELSPDEFFWARTRLELRAKDALKHANALAVDRASLSRAMTKGH